MFFYTNAHLQNMLLIYFHLVLRSPTEGTIKLNNENGQMSQGGGSQPLSCNEINAAELRWCHTEHSFNMFGGYAIVVTNCY